MIKFFNSFSQYMYYANFLFTGMQIYPKFGSTWLVLCHGIPRTITSTAISDHNDIHLI